MIAPQKDFTMAASWFEDLMGFRERSYDETRKNLEPDRGLEHLAQEFV